jgi:hypothetical protein
MNLIGVPPDTAENHHTSDSNNTIYFDETLDHLLHQELNDLDFAEFSLQLPSLLPNTIEMPPIDSIPAPAEPAAQLPSLTVVGAGVDADGNGGGGNVMNFRHHKNVGGPSTSLSLKKKAIPPEMLAEIAAVHPKKAKRSKKHYLFILSKVYITLLSSKQWFNLISQFSYHSYERQINSSVNLDILWAANAWLWIDFRVFKKWNKIRKEKKKKQNISVFGLWETLILKHKKRIRFEVWDRILMTNSDYIIEDCRILANRDAAKRSKEKRKNYEKELVMMVESLQIQADNATAERVMAMVCMCLIGFPSILHLCV